MPAILENKLKDHRIKTYHLNNRITTPAQALKFVNARGFIYFWPIKGIDMPNLWMTVAGERPVADAHDDPGHITWGWKDSALDKRQWYYAKILRRKATIISLEVAPYFYALSENFGSPEEDHLNAYEEGRLTLAAKLVYEALLKEGRLNTIDLRKAARLTSQNSDAEFNRALEMLQADFKILPVGVAQAGAWKYSHIYDITAHHYPDLVEAARFINETSARKKLLTLYFESVGAAQLRDVVKLFGWKNDLAMGILQILKEDKIVVDGVSHPQKTGEWIALKRLVK